MLSTVDNTGEAGFPAAGDGPGHFGGSAVSQQSLAALVPGESLTLAVDTADAQNLASVPVTLILDHTSGVRFVLAYLNGGSDAPVHLDVGNVGKSAFDACQNDPRMRNVVPILFGGSTDYQDPTVRLLRFANERAAMYWHLRCLLDPEGPAATRLELPPDPELTGDLLATRYEMRNDLVYIELKEKIRARIGRSPDCGDACVLACRPPKRAAFFVA